MSETIHLSVFQPFSVRAIDLLLKKNLFKPVVVGGVETVEKIVGSPSKAFKGDLSLWISCGKAG